LPTLFNVRIQNLLNELFSLWLANTILFKGKLQNNISFVFVAADGWSDWNCKLVSDTCRLVRREMAS
jgi:hypothetical protein